MTAPGDADVPSRFHVGFEGRTLLGTYRVDRRLAEGGMGAVYLAQDLNLGRRVVVKVPHVRFLAEPGFRARFRREITELVRLEHPSIVRILAQGEEDEIPFFVLQYLGGGSLEDRLAKGRQSPEEVLAWVDRVAETLDYVHGAGVVHRDVKPANVLFDEHGHVFLSDFGVVKALEHEAGATLTEAGMGVGSPIYMAPEQALGTQVGSAADQYALATTVYEALAGVPPFGRGGAMEVLLKKTRGAATSVRTLAPRVPEVCAAALDRALDADPTKRFPWCVAFVDAFRAGLVTATTLPAVEFSAPVPRRRRLLPLLVGFVAVTGTALLGASLFRRDREPTSASASDETPGFLVRLASPGAQPRALLRFAPSAGTRDVMTLVLRQTLGQKVDLERIPERTYHLEQEAHADVVARVAGGVAIRWTFGVPRVLGVDQATGSPEQAVFTALGTGSGTSVLTPRGVATDLALGYESSAPGAEGAKIALEEIVRSLAVPLPAEPVGIGAEWDATQLRSAGGVRFQETLSLRLVAREGTRFTVEGEIRHDSPKSRPGSPDEGAASALTLRGIQGSGTFSATVDPALPLPWRLSTKGELSFTAVQQKDGKTHTFEIRKAYETESARR